MNTEQQIGFDKVKEMWILLAVSSYAKEKIAGTVPVTDEKELLRQLRRLPCVFSYRTSFLAYFAIGTSPYV